MFGTTGKRNPTCYCEGLLGVKNGGEKRRWQIAGHATFKYPSSDLWSNLPPFFSSWVICGHTPGSSLATILKTEKSPRKRSNIIFQSRPLWLFSTISRLFRNQLAKKKRSVPRTMRKLFLSVFPTCISPTIHFACTSPLPRTLNKLSFSNALGNMESEESVLWVMQKRRMGM